MAKIGLYYPVYAKIEKEEYGVAPTYGTGATIGKAITADKTINFNDNPLYADGAIAENDRSFSDGSIKFGVDDITLKTTADLLGASYTEATETEPEKIVRASGNTAPYVGVGYYKKGVKNNVPYFEGTWLHKIQFAPFGETAKTKEKSIEWQTPEIEGSIMVVDGYAEGAYEETVRFTTETEVREWLNTKANITTTQG
jgi:phi13 family phage major tail protein